MEKRTVVRNFRMVDPPKGVARRAYVVGEDLFVTAESAAILDAEEPKIVKSGAPASKPAPDVKASPKKEKVSK